MNGIERDAAIVRSALAAVAWKPEERRCEAEHLFEWISRTRHALLSVEGDGRYGYAMLVEGSFVAGATPDPDVCDPLPDDLVLYLDTDEGAQP